MKKSLALLMTLIMVFSLCAIAPSAYAADKTVINVMSFTDEVPNMINRYVETHPDFADKYDLDRYFVYGYGSHHLWLKQRKITNPDITFEYRILIVEY